MVDIGFRSVFVLFLAILVWSITKFEKTNRVFSREELGKYNSLSSPNGKIYLAILGTVFDVTKGYQYYGLESPYHGFVGKDGTRAFVTGKFDHDGLTDDLSGLKPYQCLLIQEWVEFYKNHTDYKQVGILSGRFYDDKGNPLAPLQEFNKCVEEGRSEKKSEDFDKHKFPPCNTKWSEDEGSVVWCTQKSGGVDRSWTGVPRRLLTRDGSSDLKERCACVEETNLNDGRLKTFPGCSDSSPTCKVQE